MAMQNRCASTEEADRLLVRDPSKLQSGKREWPARLMKLFFVAVILAVGIVMGIVLALQISPHMITRTLLSNSCLCEDPSSTSRRINQRWFRAEDWLAEPSILHNMSDSQLLWLASLAPNRQGMPLRHTPKVAFMFLTRGPLPLAPLWERFFKGHEGLYSVYIHADPSFKLDVPVSSVFHGRQIHSKEARWGDVSMCDAERRLLANALLDLANERFVLLSETCIPLQPFPTVYSHLTLSNASFVSAFDDPGPLGKGRYNQNMAPLVTSRQWRKGSQWFEVNRKLAVFIVSDTQFYTKFRSFCRPSCYVDEHYLPTMLSIVLGSEIANRSITWVDWSRGGPHPAMFGGGDITEGFMRQMQEQERGSCTYNGQVGSICYLFARKFSPSALDQLLQLSPKVMGF